MILRSLLSGPEHAIQQIQGAERLRLMLDYDGTLAGFAPTPDEIHPDAELIELLERLKRCPRLQIAVISGRRLSHIRALIPLTGMVLAGTYGIELLDPAGRRIERLDFQAVRPALDRIKPQWQELIRGQDGFYLEDKGWSLALHARFADQDAAEINLDRARSLIEQEEISGDLFRVLGGHKFLELAPWLANKGLTVVYLISRRPLEGALPVYIGDDDKDEEAFAVILQHGGIAIKVGDRSQPSAAQLRLDSPNAVRQFLAALL